MISGFHHGVNETWDVTQHRFVVGHRRFGTTYQSHLQGSSVSRLFGNIGNQLLTYTV